MTKRESLGTDAAYLRERQYKDPSNLNARISLHARFAQAEVPWYPWLAARIEWRAGADVLEVGCGPGLLWVTIAPLLPRLHLTLTDLSLGMVGAARQAVAGIDSLELSTEVCDAQELPFADRSFDIVVANHMLYHVPEPTRAVAEFARVLRPHGVLLAATNGPRHLDVIADISRRVFGRSSLDFVAQRFGRTNGGSILEWAFGEVSWYGHPGTLICDDPDAVVAFIRSSGSGQEASAERLRTLAETVDECFEAAGGIVTMATDSGCFVARRPKGGAARHRL